MAERAPKHPDPTEQEIDRMARAIRARWRLKKPLARPGSGGDHQSVRMMRERMVQMHRRGSHREDG